MRYNAKGKKKHSRMAGWRTGNEGCCLATPAPAPILGREHDARRHPPPPPATL